MRIDKKIGCRVTIHKGSNYLGSEFNSFDSVLDIKSHIRNKYKKRGLLSVMVSQDGGYHNSFNINTN